MEALGSSFCKKPFCVCSSGHFFFLVHLFATPAHPEKKKTLKKKDIIQKKQVEEAEAVRVCFSMGLLCHLFSPFFPYLKSFLSIVTLAAIYARLTLSCFLNSFFF